MCVELLCVHVSRISSFTRFSREGRLKNSPSTYRRLVFQTPDPKRARAAGLALARHERALPAAVCHFIFHQGLRRYSPVTESGLVEVVVDEEVAVASSPCSPRRGASALSSARRQVISKRTAWVPSRRVSRASTMRALAGPDKESKRKKRTPTCLTVNTRRTPIKQTKFDYVYSSTLPRGSRNPTA